jgi:heparinase II/III-like protein
MNLSTFLSRGRKALRMPPRKLFARLADEARQQTRRPWSQLYPRVLADAAVFGESGARSFDELWELQMNAPFFLRPADRERYASAFRARYPDEVAAVVAAADAVMRHEFDLLGSGVKALGPTLPWLDDFKTGRHYPLQYCRDIQYMELDKPTDVKVPWELSRCQHLTALGQASWMTGDERYAREYRAEIEDWIGANPFAYSVNWACAMDVALRAISWIWGFYFFASSQACADPLFRRRLLRSLFMHGEFVFTHLEKSDVNGNHYLSDGAGLVFVGLFFRHTSHGRRWLEQGRSIVFGEILQQVSEDGVDFEQSTAYHRLVLELFLTSYLLLEKHGEQVPEPQRARLEKMLDFVAAYTKPNGLAPLIGDADDGRVQKLGAQTINDHRYLLSTGAVRFGRADLKQAAGRFWEESFWLLGPDAAHAFDKLPAASVEPGSAGFPSGGFFILRSPSAHVVIDCGEVGMRGHGGHGHNDITSFELFLNGMNAISDCGVYLYTASREWRNKFRSTAFHNVAQVDDEELNRFIGEDALWQLMYDAHPTGVTWQTEGRGGYFRGGHDGYARLTRSVTSMREIFVDPDRPRVTLRDRVQGSGSHRVTWRFHFDPAVAAEIIEQDCRLRCGDREIWVLADGDDRRGRRLERGWVSPSYGVRHETSVLVITDERMPCALSCVFSELRLSLDERRQTFKQLDAHRTRVH